VKLIANILIFPFTSIFGISQSGRCDNVPNGATVSTTEGFMSVVQFMVEKRDEWGQPQLSFQMLFIFFCSL